MFPRPRVLVISSITVNVNNDSVKNLIFIEAAEIFKAQANEPGYDLPKVHYKHVQKALDTFEQDFFSSRSEKVTTSDKADAISSQAKKFLRDMKSLTKNENVKTVCQNLMELIDKGTYTPLPNEIRKIRQRLDKRQLTYAQADNLLLLIAKKYDAYEITDSDEQNSQELDLNISPEIVITETFVE